MLELDPGAMIHVVVWFAVCGFAVGAVVVLWLAAIYRS